MFENLMHKAFRTHCLFFRFWKYRLFRSLIFYPLISSTGRPTSALRRWGIFLLKTILKMLSLPGNLHQFRFLRLRLCVLPLKPSRPKILQLHRVSHPPMASRGILTSTFLCTRCTANPGREFCLRKLHSASLRIGRSSSSNVECRSPDLGLWSAKSSQTFVVRAETSGTLETTQDFGRSIS